MQQQPYFSVIIPTKNRPTYLRDAIRSVSNQNFENYELIVSDNFNGPETEGVINEFKHHPNFKSIRTEREMSMPEHWEFATAKASGKYVLLLTDRKVLFQHSLKRLHHFLHHKHKDALNCISFGVQTYNEAENKMAWNPQKENTKEYSSDSLIQNFLNENYFGDSTLDRIFPKTLNGCYKNEYAQEIRTKYNSYFNTEHITTPDYSSFFIKNYLVCLKTSYSVLIFYYNNLIYSSSSLSFV